MSCVAFFKESLEAKFIFPRPLDEQKYRKMASAAQDFVFWPKKEPEEINKQKKKTLSERAESYFFNTEAASMGSLFCPFSFPTPLLGTRSAIPLVCAKTTQNRKAKRLRDIAVKRS